MSRSGGFECTRGAAPEFGPVRKQTGSLLCGGSGCRGGESTCTVYLRRENLQRSAKPSPVQ